MSSIFKSKDLKKGNTMQEAKEEINTTITTAIDILRELREDTPTKQDHMALLKIEM